MNSVATLILKWQLPFFENKNIFSSTIGVGTIKISGVGSKLKRGEGGLGLSKILTSKNKIVFGYGHV